MARTKHKDKQDADILERQYIALDLRRSGLSYRAIGQKLNVSHVQARTDVETVLRQMAAENRNKGEELRQLELERIDRAIKGLMPFVDAGSAMHVTALMKCVAERAKLQGLYEPEKVENRTTIIHELSNEERAKRIDELLNRGRARRDGRPASDELIQ